MMLDKEEPRPGDLGGKLLQLDSNQQPFDLPQRLARACAGWRGLREGGIWLARVCARTRGLVDAKWTRDHGRRTLRVVGEYGVTAVLGMLFGAAYGMFGYYAGLTARAITGSDAWAFGVTLAWVAAGAVGLTVGLLRWVAGGAR